MTSMNPIDRRILTFLAEQDWPVTTENVGEACDVTWNTAQVHLLRLLSENLLRSKRVGRQNQWMITDQGRKAVRKL